MSSLFKKTSTVWLLNGKRVTPGTPGAEKRKTKSKRWYGKIKRGGKWIDTGPLSESKTVAAKLLSKLQIEADEELLGIVGPLDKSLAELLSDYKAYLASKQSTKRYVDNSITRIETLLSVAEIQNQHQIKESNILVALARMREQVQIEAPQREINNTELMEITGLSLTGLRLMAKRLEVATKKVGNQKLYPPESVKAILDVVCKGMSAQTSNHYLAAIKGFTNWLTVEGQLAIDPLKRTRKVNTQTDERIKRRSLTKDEIAKLAEATKEQPERYGLTGHQRATLYLAATQSGLRANELASLSSRSLQDGFLVVEATDSKRKRRDFQPISSQLQNEIANLGEKPFPGQWVRRAAEMLQTDLSAAGIPITTSEGTVDFHALRSTYITLLVESGVDPKTVQILARHSTITLTMDTYAKTDRERLRKAVEGL